MAALLIASSVILFLPLQFQCGIVVSVIAYAVFVPFTEPGVVVHYAQIIQLIEIHAVDLIFPLGAAICISFQNA